jgi:hypothetical protein
MMLDWPAVALTPWMNASQQRQREPVIPQRERFGAPTARMSKLQSS